MSRLRRETLGNVCVRRVYSSFAHPFFPLPRRFSRASGALNFLPSLSLGENSCASWMDRTPGLPDGHRDTLLHPAPFGLWAMLESNQRPLRCQRTTLTTELIAQKARGKLS